MHLLPVEFSTVTSSSFLCQRCATFSKSPPLIIPWGKMARRLTKEMMEAILEGKREVSIGTSEGDVASLSVDPIPSTDMLTSPTPLVPF